MERKVIKGEYLSPQCEVIEMQVAGMIAVSVEDPWDRIDEEDF